MRALILSAVLLVAILGTLAMPIDQWRTGRQHAVPLPAQPVRIDLPPRLWIDTDAACGFGRRTDPDDCFALALLAHARGVEVVGISTVFGNAPRDAVDRVTRELVARLPIRVKVYSGAAGARGPQTAAGDAIEAALEEGPLVFLALGPLTNLAAVLERRPDLAPRIAQLVAVMGRRPGHLFHPAEGAEAGSLLGHGPVFRDFNFAQDPRAARQVLSAGLPTILVPYDAARAVEITERDLDRLAAVRGALSWIAARARAWRAYWEQEIGRQGFYPFDLVAAAFVAEPGRFRCARVQARIAEDKTLLTPFWRPEALLVGPNAIPGSVHASYCEQTPKGLKSALLARLTGRAP